MKISLNVLEKLAEQHGHEWPKLRIAAERCGRQGPEMAQIVMREDGRHVKKQREWLGAGGKDAHPKARVPQARREVEQAIVRTANFFRVQPDTLLNALVHGTYVGLLTKGQIAREVKEKDLVTAPTFWRTVREFA